ncbi:hypothetical protein [Janibacter anophelis]|uniref:hypothetical protein n=1 Tax=Janibacter anophelis TaxID=319054 RepID=UPI000A9EC8E2|nr:hypothetical protein [Janibacter anophelis]
MRKAVNLYRSTEGIAVESTSMLAGGGRVADGWTQVVGSDEATAERVGEAVLAGIERSGAIGVEALPPLGGTEATPGSRALGFETENAMLAAGVASVAVGLKGSRWKVTPMRNEGAGRGFASHPDASPVSHDGEWSAADLGAAALSALDSAAGS